MTRRSLTGWVASVLVLVGLLSPGVAAGAPPTFDRIDVDDTFADDFLTEACGVEVTTTATGHITVRTFEDGTGPTTVTTINVGLTATAGDRTFRFRDVGADIERIEPDGTIVLSIIGQVPFDFAGVLKIDPETDEVILEPRDRSEEQIARACAALTDG
jgi:hypothetical protein